MNQRTQPASRIAYERLLAAAESSISRDVAADLGPDAWHADPDEAPQSIRGNEGADAAEILEAEQGERIAMDGGHANVESVESSVELTITLCGRAALGIALSPTEARRIGEALVSAAHRAHVAQAAHVDLEGVDTVTDLFRRSQESGVPMSALVEVATRCACPDDRCAGYHHDADLGYCPCAESLAQDGAL